MLFCVLAICFPAVAQQQRALKDVFRNDFKIGAALNRRQIFEDDVRGAEIVKTQFNSITPENVLKWALVHPQPEKYDFTAPDRFVQFGEKHGMFIVGHTLVWHNQTPAWVFQDEKGNAVDRETLLQRLRDHIFTVVGRYKGRINGWDVVNEALNQDGTMRQSAWMKIIGEDYLEKAFQFAHEADPNAQLYYNDYDLELPAKRAGAVALIKKLKADRVPISGVGLQNHNLMDWPTAADEDATITELSALGIKVHITELDVDVLPRTTKPGTDYAVDIPVTPQLNPYVDRLPDAINAMLALRYAELFRVYMKHRHVIERVTFWGVSDGDSWLNNWPIKGRTNYPLLFDRNGAAKPALRRLLTWRLKTQITEYTRGIMASNNYQPKPEHKFTFGLWTVGNRGRDPFGDATRPTISPVTIVKRLSELGAYGVNLHDNDLVPIDAPAAERDRIVREFKQALEDHGMKVPMATTNLFYDPVFKDGAFTSSDPRVRLYALQKTMRSMDLGAELGAKIYVFWGGREGAEVDAAKDPREALKWNREALNFLCEYSIDQGYDYKFALEAKPNEPRGDIYLPTTGAMLGFIATLDHVDMVGVNPEVGHEQMSGLNFYHVVAQAIEAGKLFHIDLNDQKGPRFDQDLRFGSESIKNLFFLVRLLESSYDGPRHFDAHSYRSENEEGVWEFASGCMRNYLILKEKARQFDEDKEIQALLGEIHNGSAEKLGRYSAEEARRVKELSLDRAELTSKALPYERLDQLTVDILFGVR